MELHLWLQYELYTFTNNNLETGHCKYSSEKLQGFKSKASFLIVFVFIS